MSNKGLQNRIKGAAAAIGQIGSEENSIAGVLGYLLGAAYGLLRASELGFQEGTVRHPDYVNELEGVARALQDGTSLAEVSGFRVTDGAEASMTGIWLAGFYFNSALHRIAAGADRMDALQRRRGQDLDPSVPDCVQRTYEEVNKLKHSKTGGLVPGRRIVLSDAVEALEYLTNRSVASYAVDDSEE